LIVGCPSLGDLTITEDPAILANLVPITMVLNGMGWNSLNIYTYLLPTAIPSYCEVIETSIIEITEDNLPYEDNEPVYFDNS